MVYWQLLEHSFAYDAVDNLQAAVVNLVLTQIRAEMGKLDLDQTFTTRNEISEVLLRELDQATDPWRVKVTRVGMRDIVPSAGVQQAMEQQMTAEREKRAAVLRSEGEIKEAQINEARGRAEALALDARAKQEPHSLWEPMLRRSSRSFWQQRGQRLPRSSPRTLKPTRKPRKQCD